MTRLYGARIFTPLMAFLLVSQIVQAQETNTGTATQELIVPGIRITEEGVFAPGLEITSEGVAIPGAAATNDTLSQSAATSIAETSGGDYDGRRFHLENQSESDWYGASLVNAVFFQSDFRGSNFATANLSGAVGEQTDFRYSDFSLATLNDATFKQSDLRGSNFRQARLQGANFEQSDLRDVDFRGACLIGASFVYADLTGANFEGAILVNTDFVISDLTNANVAGVIRTGVNDCPPALSGDLAEGNLAEAGDEPAARPDVTDAESISSALSEAPGARIDLTVNFALDSDEIEGSGHAQLLEIAAALDDPALAGVTVVIEGHTDNSGDDNYNLDLSYRRAVSVARYLVDVYGIDRRRLSISGFGETQPIANNETEAGRALNRRVTLVRSE